jgi:DNA polymerase-1
VPQKRYREALLANAEAARNSRELLRIRTDVPVEADVSTFEYRGPSRERCYDLFSRLGFRTLLMDYAPTADTVAKSYTLVTTEADLEALAVSIRQAGRIGVHVVSDGASPLRARVIGVAVATAPRTAWYVPISRRAGSLLDSGDGLELETAMAVLGPALADDRVAKVGHDLKAAALMFGRQGVALGGLAFDTMIASYLIDPTRSAHSLEDTALEHLGYKAVTEDSITGKGVKAAALADLPAEVVRDFAAERADLPLQLAEDLPARLDAEDLTRVWETLERPLLHVLIGIEQAGVRIDGAVLASQSAHVEKEMAALSRKIFDLAGVEFNINSPKQLGEVLFEKLELPSLKRTGKTRAVSTAVEVLEELAATHELPRLVLDWRGLQKLKGTYIDALPQLVNPQTGRVHTSFNQAVAATGRLSSSDPNLQNIPIRSDLGTRDPPCVHRRAGQRPDLRLTTRRSNCGCWRTCRATETLIAAFQRGDDIHDQTALKVFGANSGLSPHELRPAREDRQLRAAVRQDGLHAGQRHRRHATGGAGSSSTRTSQGFPRVRAFIDQDARPGACHRRGQDDVRAAPSGARNHQPQRPGAGLRRAHDREHADSGHGRRHSQAGHDRPRRRARTSQCRQSSAGRPDDSHGARRARARSA